MDNIKKYTRKTTADGAVTESYEFHVPPMQEIPKPVEGDVTFGNPAEHPGEPRGVDTIPAWLSEGEFVVNPEAVEMYGPEIEAMNNHGRIVQAAEGGLIPPMYKMEGGKVKYKAEGGIIGYLSRLFGGGDVEEPVRQPTGQMRHNTPPRSEVRKEELLPPPRYQGLLQGFSDTGELPFGEEPVFDNQKEKIPSTSLYQDALKELSKARGWSPEEAAVFDTWREKVGTVESNNRYDAKQMRNGPGRGAYQYELSQGGSGAATTAVNRLRNFLPKIGKDLNELPESDLSVIFSEDPDFSKLSKDTQDLIFLANHAEAKSSKLNDLVRGKVSKAEAWADWHWKGDPKERESKLEQFRRNVPNFQQGGLVENQMGMQYLDDLIDYNQRGEDQMVDGLPVPPVGQRVPEIPGHMSRLQPEMPGIPQMGTIEEPVRQPTGWMGRTALPIIEDTPEPVTIEISGGTPEGSSRTSTWWDSDGTDVEGIETQLNAAAQQGALQLDNSPESNEIKRSAWQDVTGFLNEWGLGDFIDKQQVGRLAGLYLGSRVLGYNSNDSLQFASKAYLKGVGDKQAMRQQLLVSGKYKPDSVKEAMDNNDLSLLQLRGEAFVPTGESKFVRVNQGTQLEPKWTNVKVEKVKVGNATYWVDSQGNQLPMTSTRVAEFDPALHDPRSKAYADYNDRASSSASDAFKEVYDMYGVIGRGEKVVKAPLTPNAAARDFVQWTRSNGMNPLDPSVMAMRENAYRSYLAAWRDQRTGRDDKTRVNLTELRPYLEQQQIFMETGTRDLMVTGITEDGVQTYVRPDKVNTLRGAIIDKAKDNKVPATVAVNQAYTESLREWTNMSPEQKRVFESMASDKRLEVTPFFAYLESKYK